MFIPISFQPNAALNLEATAQQLQLWARLHAFRPNYPGHCWTCAELGCNPTKTNLPICLGQQLLIDVDLSGCLFYPSSHPVWHQRRAYYRYINYFEWHESTSILPSTPGKETVHKRTVKRILIRYGNHGYTLPIFPHLDAYFCVRDDRVP